MTLLVECTGEEEMQPVERNQIDVKSSHVTVVLAREAEVAGCAAHYVGDHFVEVLKAILILRYSDLESPRANVAQCYVVQQHN